MSYTPTNWENRKTPINATNLNKMESGIKDNSDRLDTVESTLSGHTTKISNVEQTANNNSDRLDSVEEAIDDVKAGLDTANSKIASQTEAGLMRGGENYVDESGTLILTKQTSSPTLHNSYAGGIKLNSIEAVEDVQDGTPTPENSFEIKNVEISEIKTEGKNLIPYPYYNKTPTINGVTFTELGDGSISASGTSSSSASFIFSHRIDNIMVLGAGTYRLSGCPSGGSRTTFRLVVARSSESTGSFEALAFDYGEGDEFTLEKDTDIYVGFEVLKDATVSNVVCKPMVCIASITDATWEPYKESVITLSQPIELRGNGDMKDEIINKNGILKVVRKRGKRK
jgi:hypothetical protein